MPHSGWPGPEPSGNGRKLRVSDRAAVISPGSRNRPVAHHLAARLDRRGHLLPARPAPLSGEPVQRPLRHHHALPAQQDPDLDHRHPRLDPRGDLLAAALQFRPSLAVPIRPDRRTTDTTEPAAISSSDSCPSPPPRDRPAATAADTYRVLVLRSTPAYAATACSLFPASQARSTSRTSITDTSGTPSRRPSVARLGRSHWDEAGQATHHARWSSYWRRGGPMLMAENPQPGPMTLADDNPADPALARCDRYQGMVIGWFVTFPFWPSLPEGLYTLRAVERSHETLWLTAFASLLGLAGGLLGVSATFSGSHGQGAFWVSGLTIAAYIVTVLGGVCFLAAMRQWPMPLTGDRPKRHVSAGQEAEPLVIGPRPAAADAEAVNQGSSAPPNVSREVPVQAPHAVGYARPMIDRALAEPQLADASPSAAPSHSPTVIQHEANPTFPDIRWPRQPKRRYVAIAAFIAVACGSLSALGAHLAQGSQPPATKMPHPRLQAPQTVSKVGVCHNAGGTFAALRMSSGVVLNLGVANVTAGATKWGQTADAAYNQDIETELVYGNQSSSRQDLGFTAQLLQPFSHKGDIWTITWRAKSGGATDLISISVNVGRPDARLVYAPGSSKLDSPNVAGKGQLSTVDDSELLDPSQPLQTLYPDSFAGGSSLTAHFLVEVAGFVDEVNAESPTNGNWFSDVYAMPGDVLPVAITVEDGGNTTLYGTTVNLALPHGLSYIPGSTSVGSSATARGKPIPDGIIVPNNAYPGINLGTLLPGQKVVVRFKVRINNDVPDGDVLKSTSFGHAASMAYYYGVLTVNVQ